MEKLKERLRHALLAFLLSVGLSMPLCGALDETLISPRILVMIAGIILLFEIAAIHKVSAFTAILITASGCAAWIFGGNGARILSDVGLAIGFRKHSKELHKDLQMKHHGVKAQGPGYRRHIAHLPGQHGKQRPGPQRVGLALQLYHPFPV